MIALAASCFNNRLCVLLQAAAQDSRQQVNVQDLTRGIAQRAAQQGSGSNAIQPKDAVAAARAGTLCFPAKRTYHSIHTSLNQAMIVSGIPALMLISFRYRLIHCVGRAHEECTARSRKLFPFI